MSKLSLREIAQSQLDSTPVIDGQLIVCLDTGNAYRDTSTAHVKIGSDLEVVSDLPLAPLAEKLYYLKPDKLYVFLGGNWTLLNDKTIDLDESIAKLPAGSSTDLNDDVEIITQDTDFTQPHYYRRKLVVLWEYIKAKAQDFFAAKDHKHKKADITDFPTSMPASDVHPWAKEATKPSYTKAEVGLGNVDNTADADKTVKRATTAGTADTANSVTWENVKDKPTTFPVETHNHDDRYYTEAEVNSKLNGKVDNTEAGANGLFSKLSVWTATPTDDTYFMRQDTDGTNQFGRVKFSTIWNYIKSKADGTYQPKGSYAASSHTHDDRYYTEAEVDGKLSGKSNTGHTHDDRYYTESEIESKLSGKADTKHIHLNGTTGGDVDWNTFITYGVYKIQNCTMSDDYHAPNPEYQYGILQVLDSENNVGEKRILQIYWPHCTPNGNHFWYRMHNGSDTNDSWTGWTQIKKKPDTAGVADYATNAGSANGVTPEWSGSVDLNNSSWLAAWSSDGKKIKAMSTGTFATAGHTHDMSTLTGNVLNTEPGTSNHKVVLGKSGLNKCEFYEYGGIWNFYKMNPSQSLIASIQPDGIHAALKGTADVANVANFAKETYISQYKTVNLTDLDQNTWYPVTGDSIPYNGLRRFKCNVQLNSGSKPNWSTHSGGFTAVVDILYESSGWGTTNMQGMVLINSQLWINDYNKPPVGYSQMSAGSIPVWWLRGGGSYRLATDYDITWTIRKSTFTNNGQSVSPTTTYPGVYVNRSTIVANLNGNASTSDIATTGVRDYNNAGNTIKIGWSGADLDKNTLAYIAGYTSDMKIHTASKDGVRSWIGLGNAAYKNVRSLSNVGSSGWANQSTDDGYVPTMAFMAFWNGAYGGTSSNLQYCDRGRFGTIVTKNSGDYAVAGHGHSSINSLGAKNAQTGRNQAYGNVYSYNSNASAYTGMPTTYTSTIGFGQGAAGTVEICGEWTSGRGLWARALRDCCDDWYSWQRIYTDNYHPNADKATFADYLNFTVGNEINFNGTPSNNVVCVGYRNSSINEYRFYNGNAGYASVTASAFNGKATSAGVADSATTSNGVKDYNDGNRTIQIGYAGAGLNTSNLSHIAGYTDNGTKIKDVSKDVLTSWIGLGNYLPLSGGVVTGQIKKDTGGSWIGDRDRVLARSHYPGDWAYGAVAGIATKSGFWTMGALGGWEDLVFNYSTDSNYSAGNNSTSQVRLPAQAGTIITSATIGSQTVNRAEYLGNDSAYMRMHWNGQSGQPTWLWGGNDASNMYVWNPSNFSVNYANSAGNGTADFQTKVTSDGQFGAVRFNNGVQICWFTMKNTRNKTFLLPFADTNYAIAFSGGYCWLDVDSRTTTGFTTGAQWSGYENSYIAIGRWR